VCCDVLSQVLASEQFSAAWTTANCTEHRATRIDNGRHSLCQSQRHTHGSAAVIGRKSGSAQVSWDDACTASVPTWPRWAPTSQSGDGPA